MLQRILAPLLLLSLLSALSADESKKATFELRLAQDGEHEGWLEKKVGDSNASDRIFVAPKAELTGKDFHEISFKTDVSGNPLIGFKLTEAAGKRMVKLTKGNVGKRLAIMLNGKVISAPAIRATITTDGQISGNFDKENLLAIFQATVLHGVSSDAAE